MRTRNTYTEDEIALIVGGYRLSDGYQQDYCERIGIKPTTLSYMVKRAIADDLRKKYPQHFGDIAAEKEVVRHIADPLLMAENQALREKLADTNAKLAIAENRLQKALRILVDNMLAELDHRD